MLVICLTTFLPFDRKRFFEATNSCTQRFARYNLFDSNRQTLVKRYVAVFVVVVIVFFSFFFFIKEKRVSPKHICIINISIDVQMVNGVKHS